MEKPREITCKGSEENANVLHQHRVKSEYRIERLEV